MAFGTQTDHFDILTRSDGSAGTLNDYLKMVSSSNSPVAQNNADATDINGDLDSTSYFGNSSGTYSEASTTFVLYTGSIDLNTLDLGEVSTGKNITSITVETSNTESEHPTITVSGHLGASEITAPSGLTNLFTLPSITVTANSFAQPLGFTVDSGLLQSCSFEASCNIGMANDGAGEPAAFGLSGAEATVSAEFVNTTVDPAWTLSLSGLTEVQAPTNDEPQAEWDTSSASARVLIARNSV